MTTTGDFLGCRDWRGALASTGWRPEMLLDTLQCRGQPLPKENNPHPNVHSVEVDTTGLVKIKLLADC